MIYTRQTKKALRIAFDAHKEQTDKSGAPYIFHPFHLAGQMNTEEEVTVALLHDVMEDTPTTLDDLRAHGFSPCVLDALAVLTHRPGVSYADYIEQIARNALARSVKLADLRHNSDTTRLERVDEKAAQRVEKYQQAMAVLLAADEAKTMVFPTASKAKTVVLPAADEASAAVLPTASNAKK